MTWEDINEEQKRVAGFNFDYGPLLDELYAKLPDAPIVVELGTFLGCSTVYMAQKALQTEKGLLYTVDTFDQYANTKAFFIKTVSNFKACGVRDKIHVLSCRSWEAAQLFDDKEVDFVWVDAGHDFLSVKGDLEAWAPKVKPGGILGGHDYSEPGVAQAVERFCFTTGKMPTVFNPEGWKSWWVTM